MPTEHDMAVAMATEIGKQVPVKQVYEDTASPAARQVGATLEDVVKCIRLVGFPIQWLAVQQDRFRLFIERAKEPIPEEDRILPNPRILGPLLEAIRYQTDDDELSDMFENLLSASMDVTRAHLVHPAFALILGRITPDEAKLLRYIKTNHLPYIISSEGSPLRHFLAVPAPEGLLEYAVGMQVYIDNLQALGLIDFYVLDPAIHKTEHRGNFTRLSGLGNRLIEACVRREGVVRPL